MAQVTMKVAPSREARVARSRPGLRAGARYLATFLVFVVMVALWQVTADNWIKPVWISSPNLVAHRMATTFGNGSLLTNTWATTEEALLGLIAGCLGGIVLGILLARAGEVAGVIDPYIMGAYSLPRVALAPFFVLWFGIGLDSKVALVISIVLFVVLFNVRQGMDSIDQDLVDVMRSMRASRRVMLRHVVIPSLLPWIVSAVKIGIGMALIGAVIGEFVGADKGLGWMVTNSLGNFNMTGAITALVIMAAIAMVLFYLVSGIERWLFRWRPAAQGSASVPM